MVVLKLLSTLSWHSEVGNNECKCWWNKFWFDFVLESLENEMQTSSVMWDTIVYNTSFFLLASFSSASCRISLLSFCVSAKEQRACLVCVELGCWEYGKWMQCVAQVYLILFSKQKRLGNIPSPPLPPPFSLFPVSFQKKGLDVRYWPITMWVSPQKKNRRRRIGGGGLCKYSETTEINRAEKNSGKKSAWLRVKGFCCWLWVF